MVSYPRLAQGEIQTLRLASPLPLLFTSNALGVNAVPNVANINQSLPIAKILVVGRHVVGAIVRGVV